MELELAKYQAIGNDFLVVVDRGRALDPGGDLAAACCDRHRGVGADGLIRLSDPDGAGAVRMELWNADGGPAETSGNGLRCAALAAIDAGLVAGPAFVVETAAGAAAVEVAGWPGPADVRVSMGVATLGPEVAAVELVLEGAAGVELARLAGFAARRVDVGNPHLVLLGKAPAGRGDGGGDGGGRSGGRAGGGAVAVSPPVDLDVLGPALERSVPGGVNVELVVPGGPGRLLLEVWERGAGRTLACGSGSCAAAAAARAAGAIGDRAVVENPGGELVVELEGDPLAPAVALRGPARRVARVTVDPDALERRGARARRSGP